MQLIRHLFENNKRELLKFLTRRVGREEAPDLLQEAYARVLVATHDGKDIADPSAYLRRTAANLATDFTRRRINDFKVLVFDDRVPDALSSDPTPEESLEALDNSRQLAAAVGALPPKCREVFMMRMYEGVGHDEIAKRLGISRKMVERHMKTAIQRCRKALR
ncbi:RNA polymerase sigma factor [Methylocystis parvus]|uniref:Sigma-70 family RNA polymerase sigma factor n=1 Tax=Methylocystis parvus TaxID=134 RepID=A0A6B8M544_9HYPH|nr:sigma-70 family RNA polymerase sigma factor [Methylocystis parvus]QGN00118.1 sigma-70 family RNA polymerase sigma factor [Methylocystis parvus]WBK02381.1 sigma-70 family RNA polymerase sigma factor [Methylocystis parvus OBBP]